MSKTSRRWRRVWLVRILPPVSAGYTNGWEKKSTLRRGDGSRDVIVTKPPSEHEQDVCQEHDYFAVSSTNRMSCLRNRPPTSCGRMGTVSTPTARPNEVSGAFAYGLWGKTGQTSRAGASNWRL